MPRAFIDSVLPGKENDQILLKIIKKFFFFVVPGGVTQTGSLVNSASK